MSIVAEIGESIRKLPPQEAWKLAADLRDSATIYEVNTSHVPVLSNPKLVIDVIRAAANT
jgi:hypothetical protein